MLLKRILAGVLCAVIVAGTVYYGCTFRFFDRALSAQTQEQFQRTIALPDNFALTASADRDDKGRNSLQTIRQSVSEGAYALELNIAFDENDVPYLADGATYITPQSVTLEQVIRENAAHPYLRYILTLHNFAPSGPLFALLRDNDLLDRVILCGFTTETLTANKRLYSRFKLCVDVDTTFLDLNDEQTCQQLHSTVFNAGASYVRCGIENATPLFSYTLQTGTIKLILDSVETEYDMYRALSMNPIAVITTHPEQLYALLFNNDYLHPRMESSF